MILFLNLFLFLSSGVGKGAEEVEELVREYCENDDILINFETSTLKECKYFIINWYKDDQMIAKAGEEMGSFYFLVYFPMLEDNLIRASRENGNLIILKTLKSHAGLYWFKMWCWENKVEIISKIIRLKLVTVNEVFKQSKLFDKTIVYRYHLFESIHINIPVWKSCTIEKVVWTKNDKIFAEYKVNYRNSYYVPTFDVIFIEADILLLRNPGYEAEGFYHVVVYYKSSHSILLKIKLIRWNNYDFHFESKPFNCKLKEYLHFQQNSDFEKLFLSSLNGAMRFYDAESGFDVTFTWNSPHISFLKNINLFVNRLNITSKNCSVLVSFNVTSDNYFFISFEPQKEIPNLKRIYFENYRLYSYGPFKTLNMEKIFPIHYNIGEAFVSSVVTNSLFSLKSLQDDNYTYSPLSEKSCEILFGVENCYFLPQSIDVFVGELSFNVTPDCVDDVFVRYSKDYQVFESRGTGQDIKLQMKLSQFSFWTYFVYELFVSYKSPGPEIKVSIKGPDKVMEGNQVVHLLQTTSVVLMKISDDEKKMENLVQQLVKYQLCYDKSCLYLDLTKKNYLSKIKNIVSFSFQFAYIEGKTSLNFYDFEVERIDLKHKSKREWVIKENEKSIIKKVFKFSYKSNQCLNEEFNICQKLKPGREKNVVVSYKTGENEIHEDKIPFVCI